MLESSLNSNQQVNYSIPPPPSPVITNTKPRKLFIYPLLILSIILILLGGYFFYQRSKGNLSPSQIAQKPEQQEIDVLALPGWSKYPDVVTRLSDNSLQVSSIENGTEMHVHNGYDYIDAGANGFEIQVKMRTVSNKGSTVPATSAIVLYDENDKPARKLPLRIQIGFNEKHSLEVIFVDLNQTDISQRAQFLVTSQNSVQPTSDELRIKFTDGAEKKLDIYDGAIGKLLAENIQLPAPFFAKGFNKVYFGLYPQGMDSAGVTMTVNYFKVIKN